MAFKNQTTRRKKQNVFFIFLFVVVFALLCWHGMAWPAFLNKAKKDVFKTHSIHLLSSVLNLI